MPRITSTLRLELSTDHDKGIKKAIKETLSLFLKLLYLSLLELHDCFLCLLDADISHEVDKPV